QLAAKARPDLPEPALHRVAVEILASQPGTTAHEACEAIHQKIVRYLRIDPDVKKAMKEAFAVVLQECRNITLKESPVLENVGRQVHCITGGRILDFAEKLRQAAKQLASKEFNVQKTEEFCKRYRSLDNLPGQHGDDPQKRQDAAWLSQRRQAKQGRSPAGFYSEMDEIAARHDMAGLFDVRDPRAEALRRAREL